MVIQIPPNRNQSILRINDRSLLELFSTTDLPNGVNDANPSLKHWIPNGIPTIVQHKITPAKRYSMQITKPPKKIQSKLPIMLIYGRFCWSNVVIYVEKSLKCLKQLSNIKPNCRYFIALFTAFAFAYHSNIKNMFSPQIQID